MCICEVMVCGLGFVLRLGIPAVILFGAGWLLGKHHERQNSSSGEEMTIRYMRTMVWTGSLLVGTFLSSLTSFFTLNVWYILVGLFVYLISGYLLDKTVQTYSAADRKFFTRRRGRKMPFLMGIGGPFYIFWEFLKMSY